MAATARQEREMKQKYEKMKHNNNLSAMEQLRAFVLSKGVRSLKSINRVFKQADAKGDRKIELSEFRTALHNQGIFVDPNIEQQCFDQLDRDKSGTLDLDEFIVALRPPMSKHRNDLVHQAFHKLDKDGSGVVTTADLKGVFNAAKHPKYISGELTEEMVFQEFLNSFNGPANTSGEITMGDFENYYAAVSSSVDSDAYFDLMMRKAWKL